MRDSPAGDATYFLEAVGDLLRRYCQLEGLARVAMGARGQSPEFASPSTFSTPSLGFSDFDYLLWSGFRTASTRRCGCVEATLAIVTTTTGVLHFGLGGNGCPVLEHDVFVAADCPMPRFNEWS